MIDKDGLTMIRVIAMVLSLLIVMWSDPLRLRIKQSMLPSLAAKVESR